MKDVWLIKLKCVRQLVAPSGPLSSTHSFMMFYSNKYQITARVEHTMSPWWWWTGSDPDPSRRTTGLFTAAFHPDPVKHARRLQKDILDLNLLCLSSPLETLLKLSCWKKQPTEQKNHLTSREMFFFTLSLSRLASPHSERITPRRTCFHKELQFHGI